MLFVASYRSGSGRAERRIQRSRISPAEGPIIDAHILDVSGVRISSIGIRADVHTQGLERERFGARKCVGLEGRRLEQRPVNLRSFPS